MDGQFISLLCSRAAAIKAEYTVSVATILGAVRQKDITYEKVNTNQTDGSKNRLTY